MRYEIERFGTPENTGKHRTDKLAPRGPFQSEEEAEGALCLWLDLCEDLAGTVKAAHNPRVTPSE